MPGRSPAGTHDPIRRSVAYGIVLLAGVCATAAAPVEEAHPVQLPVAEAPVAADRPGESAGGVGTLFYQLQILQDEVRRLQGIIEEQNYRIDRLVREQRERYIELDQRLLALRPDAAQPPDPGAASETETPAEPAQGTVSGQSDAYNRAFAVLTEARDLPGSERLAGYQRALEMFEALIRAHPNGEYTPNAYYWMGELHLATDDLEQARQAFAQVANLYGDHAKAPDALYKLGVTYHRLGENERALQYLDRVVNEHPDHTAARLARSYAAELR